MGTPFGLVDVPASEHDMDMDRQWEADNGRGRERRGRLGRAPRWAQCCCQAPGQGALELKR